MCFIIKRAPDTPSSRPTGLLECSDCVNLLSVGGELCCIVRTTWIASTQMNSKLLALRHLTLKIDLVRTETNLPQSRFFCIQEKVCPLGCGSNKVFRY